MLLMHDLVGLPITLYRRHQPRPKNGYRGTKHDICPDMAACRALVRSPEAVRASWCGLSCFDYDNAGLAVL